MFRRKKPPQQPTTRNRPGRPQPSREPLFMYHSNRVREDRLTRQMEDDEPGATAPVRPARRMFPKRLVDRSLVVLVVLFALLWVQLNGAPRIVVVSGNQSVAVLQNQQIYEQAASNLLSRLSNRNKLTVNTDKVASQLEQEFPELETVSVSLPLIGNRPVVTIQPAVPELMFVTQDGTFVLDSNGRAVASSSQITHVSSLHLPVVDDQSGLPASVGKIVLPQTTVAFISEVVGQLQAKNLGVNTLVLPSGATELQVGLKGEAYVVKYGLYGDAREEVGTYLATKRYLETNHITPSTYVDVRVPGKAYYK